MIYIESLLIVPYPYELCGEILSLGGDCLFFLCAAVYGLWRQACLLARHTLLLLSKVVSGAMSVLSCDLLMDIEQVVL